MPSITHEYGLSSLRKQIGLERKQSNARSIWTRGRVLEASTHGAQLHIDPDPHYDMVDEATGRFYFVPGFSMVTDDGTGGDIVRD